MSALRAALAAIASLTLGLSAAAAPARLDPVTIIAAGAPVNTITPIADLGAALDGMEKGEVNLYLTPFNIEKMQGAGLRRLTYRTRPELGIEVWHWTEDGTWSDAANAQGYWTGNDDAGPGDRVTWGYSLPRRGDSVDNATNVGYSRLDDGDPTSFWKSNPYLDRRFTGAATNRPQYAVLSFRKLTPIDGARILWGTPYASHYLIQYWRGTDLYWDGKDVANRPGKWTTFPNGDQSPTGPPGEGVLRLSGKPILARFIRILMLTSSETGPPGSTDIRDRLGYAIREVSFGLVGPDGALKDAIKHGKDQEHQTLAQVSSTDPWHRAIDRDLGTEQPSLDLVFGAGLNGGQPLMVPVGTFYDTPENAAAEIRWIRRRGWPVTQVELGEEPDGQFIAPEDYADLYLEVAKAVHGVDRTLSLGGPSMQGALTGTWPDQGEGRSWTGRFVDRLKARGGLGEFQFFSFEHYVFDDVCRPLGGMLRDETDIMDKLMSKTAAAGVPTTIPWIISEYGFSPFAGRAQSEIPSALLAADIVGHFFTRGGKAAYMFGLTPDQPANQNFPCAGYGNMMLFEADDDGLSKWPMPTYFGEQMMVNDWGAPADQPHQLFIARSTLKDAKGRAYVAAYPLRAPGGRWTVMLVNRDQYRAHRVPLRLQTADSDSQPFGAGGPVDVVQYSSAQYAWLAHGEESHPVKDLPPVRFAVKAGEPLTLPAMSLTVVSGAGPAAP